MRGILLAAGASTRFGADKLLHPFDASTTVVEAAARTLLTALPDSIAVVRPGHDELAARLRALGLDVVACPEAERGIGHSVAAGIAAARSATGWVIALGDMPFVQPNTVAKIAAVAAGADSIGVPRYQGARGNPVGFGAEWGRALLQLEGDRGARDLIARHRARVTWVVVDDPGVVRDIDRPGDLPGKAFA
jgi:molybdenum cofactor cytidylyltransferase